MGVLAAIHDFATLLSLSLTPPTIIGSIGVVYLWWTATHTALNVENKTPRDWFVLGVSASFMGATVDNTWWGIAWTADYLNHPSRDFWFENGVYSNIVFRQGATLLAAYCHIRAARSVSSLFLRSMIASWWATSILVVVVLYTLQSVVPVSPIKNSSEVDIFEQPNLMGPAF